MQFPNRKLLRKSMNIKITLLIINLLILTGCYGKITGQVVDAETGKPLEGAVILVEWTKTSGLGHTSTESFKVVEAVTDKNGKAGIEGLFSLRADYPSVTVYKKGYVAWNSKKIFPSYDKREDFEWDSTYEFRLEKFKDRYSYGEHVSFIRS